MNVYVCMCVVDLDYVKINIKLAGCHFLSCQNQIYLRTYTTRYAHKHPVFRMTRSKSRLSVHHYI